MNTFNHRVRYSQGDVPAFVSRISFPYDNHAWLVLEEIPDLVCAQIPHLSNFSNGVVPLDRSSVLDLR